MARTSATAHAVNAILRIGVVVFMEFVVFIVFCSLRSITVWCVPYRTYSGYFRFADARYTVQSNVALA
jgi:hypothetical protein